MREKKSMIERKMQQAEEKRLTMLKTKAQKAHDEEAKVSSEIPTIPIFGNHTDFQGHFPHCDLERQNYDK